MANNFRGRPQLGRNPKAKEPGAATATAPKPVLYNDISIAVVDGLFCRFALYGTNMDPAIGKDDVTVNDGDIEVKQARVKGNVLIVKTVRVPKPTASTTETDDVEIAVTVTNPGDPTNPPSEPIAVPVVYDQP